ncbi:DMT family transporter [uncultured Amnibacterium sp.]|uniref:DMT family transporter n=1 Tax=uncultured Amnibacterium sp. TaxID=1631851 RepID=UPI0035C98771
MSWLFLAAAIVVEVTATLCLSASKGLRDKRWAVPILVGYVASFYFLALALREGLPVGVAYGVWAATGIALTAIFGRVLFRDPLNRTMGLGLVLIGIGVLLVELGTSTVTH